MLSQPSTARSSYSESIFTTIMATVDRGWAWLVCLGAFIIMLLETGMVKALGVLLPVLRQQFGTKTWVIGLIISLVPGIGVVICK